MPRVDTRAATTDVKMRPFTCMSVRAPIVLDDLLGLKVSVSGASAGDVSDRNELLPMCPEWTLI